MHSLRHPFWARPKVVRGCPANWGCPTTQWFANRYGLGRMECVAECQLRLFFCLKHLFLQALKSILALIRLLQSKLLGGGNRSLEISRQSLPTATRKTPVDEVT